MVPSSFPKLRAVGLFLRYVVLRGLRAWIGRWFGINTFKISQMASIKLRMAPRFQTTHIKILGRKIEVTDSIGAWSCCEELLIDEIYRFRSSRPNPNIIDCGANIGLSIIYFKHIYPDAIITAFEPDPTIFGALERNIRACRFSGVQLRREAVWTTQGKLNFRPDGGFGGRVEACDGISVSADISVPTVRLRDFLERPVDFLKIDIEGAESTVIEDCHDRLVNVDHLFVEYHGRREEPQGLGKMLEMIRLAGLRYYIKEAAIVRHPFDLNERLGGEFDMQLNIFAHRE